MLSYKHTGTIGPFSEQMPHVASTSDVPMEIAPCSKEPTQVLDSSLSGQADTEVLLAGGIDGPQLTE